MSSAMKNRETVYAQAMANAETWLKGTRHNMVAKAFGKHEGYLADVLTDSGNYTLKLRSNSNHSVLFMQATAAHGVAPEKRDELNAFLARETEGMLVGRVFIDDSGSLVAHTTIDLDCFARQHRMISPLLGLMCRDGGQVDSETAQAVADMVARHCAPDVELFKELGDLLLHIVFDCEEALEDREEPKKKVERAKAGYHPANPDTDGTPGPNCDPETLARIKEELDAKFDELFGTPEEKPGSQDVELSEEELQSIQDELFARFDELFGSSDEVPSAEDLTQALEGLSDEKRKALVRAGILKDARPAEEDVARLDQEFLKAILGEEGLRELNKFPDLGAFLESRSISELQEMIDRSVPLLAREDAPEAPAETPEEDEDDDAILDAMFRKIDANHAAKKRQELGVDTGDVYTAPFTTPLPDEDGGEEGEDGDEGDDDPAIPGIMNIPDEDGDE